MVRACKYPPRGHRSFGPVRASLYAGADYAAHANDEIVVLPMIETKEALKNLDEILSTPGVDGVYVGPSDLSLDMGIHKQYTNPKFIEALDKVVDAGREHGVAPGMHCFVTQDATDINDAIKRGFRFCALDTDLGYLSRSVKTTLGYVKGWKPGEGGEAPAV